MELLKKIFPLSWKYTQDITNLIIGILIYVVGGAIAGAIIGILGQIPIIGFIFGLVGAVVGLYAFAGIVLQILIYTKVIKD